VVGHVESQDLHLRRSPGKQMFLSYLALASIPIVIFVLLLLVARQH
jgi:hypothetical protein